MTIIRLKSWPNHHTFFQLEVQQHEMVYLVDFGVLHLIPLSISCARLARIFSEIYYFICIIKKMAKQYRINSQFFQLVILDHFLDKFLWWIHCKTIYWRSLNRFQTLTCAKKCIKTDNFLLILINLVWYFFNQDSTDVI